MKQRPMVLIFAGVLSGTAVVWNIMSMTAAFYLLTGICLLASLIFSDRRYGWVVVGILAGILLSLGFKTSMKLDLIQVKEKATEYTMGRVLEVSKTKKGKLAVLLKNKNLDFWNTSLYQESPTFCYVERRATPVVETSHIFFEQVKNNKLMAFHLGLRLHTIVLRS